MIEVKDADDLFTEEHESEPKPEAKKKPEKEHTFDDMAKFMREYYNALIREGFSKKEALELTKELLSVSVNGVAKNLMGAILK